MVCDACNNFHSCEQSRDMTNVLVQRLFDIDLWFVGAAHFMILLASFKVPYRPWWKQDLQMQARMSLVPTR